MNAVKWALPAIVVVGAGVAIYLSTVESEPTSAAETVASSAAVTEDNAAPQSEKSAKSAKRKRTAVAGSTSNETKTPEPPVVPPDELYATSTDLSMTLHELVSRFERGETETAFEISSIYDECADNSRTLDDHLVYIESMEMVDASPEAIAWAETNYQRCMAFEMDEEELRREAQLWKERALDDRHPVALAENLIDLAMQEGLDAANRTAYEVFKSGHPSAMPAMSGYLDYLDTHHRDVRPNLNMEHRRSALELLGCDLGNPGCQPGSRQMLMSCSGYEDTCNPNMPLSAHMFENLLSPADARRVMDMHQQFRNALRTGNFDLFLAIGYDPTG